jgi:hypothetical protein
MELFQANRQWSTRPDDERYPTLEALHEAATTYRRQATERNKVPVATLSAVEADGEVKLQGKGGIPAKLSHWAFGQVAKFAGAPADYLRQLPAKLATDNLNHGLVQRTKDTVVNLLFHQNGGLLLRAFTSDIYSRIWNNEVTERLLDYAAQGWQPATPTMNPQDDGKDTALYVSDHDMFAFITHPDRIIRESGNDKGLMRGLIAINSEVGARKIVLMRFLYREMCGNHIIWGAEDVVEMSAKHVGDVRGKWGLWAAEVKRYLDESPQADEARILAAQRKLIAGTKDELLDALFGKRSLQLSRKALTAGYEAVVPEQDGNPLSYWGMAQGLTRYSQTLTYADKRTDIDAAAGKVLAMAF